MKKKLTAPALPKEKLIKLYRAAIQAGISLEAVHQKVDHLTTREQVVDAVEVAEEKRRQPKLSFKRKFFFTVLPLTCVLIGLSLVGSAVWPLFSYYIFTPDDFYKSSLLAPIPREQVLDVMPRIVVQAQETTPGDPRNDRNGTYVAPTILNDDLDFTNLSNWFPNLAIPNVDQSKTLEYTLDIPTVNIVNAKVQLGGSSLDKNVIQYPGTALPGDLGSPVLFGHSILRQFYNPSEKNPNRYLSIFSTIMTLKTGDKMYITVGNVKYTYEVVEKRVVHPDDTFILEQQYDDREIKLITCVPEGTIKDRGVVIGRLVKGD